MNKCDVWSEMNKQRLENKTKQPEKNVPIRPWFGAAVNSNYTCNNESTGYTCDQKWMRGEDQCVCGKADRGEWNPLPSIAARQ